ncbi:MAG: UDP-N-acetylglucosamine 2-epimerase (hydrolyzing) [Spirochaetes bacterium]|nr:UDP-N-acetylglucosamine 2-epimerase (hydrolyzing) [Spirochaetota bacterium]
MKQKKRKIAVVITSRASYARVKSLLKAISKNKNLELILIGAASLILEKYGNAHMIMEKEGFKINEKVYMVIEGENPATMAKTVGVGIIELATIFDNYKPDIVVSIADRFETVATAIAGSYLNIPIAHIQGGEITGSIDEKVRHAVTKFASAHFVSNEFAFKRVRQMGEPEDTIYITGCPSIDLADAVLKDPEMKFKFFEKYGGVGDIIDLNKDFIVVMQHSVTTEFSHAYEQMWETLMAVDSVGIPAIIMWPNMDAGSDRISKAIRTYRELHKPQHVHFFKNFQPQDFLKLLLRSKGIVGNSSVGIREGSFLGVPAVNIGNRQLGREQADNVVNVDYDRKKITQAIKNHIIKNQRFPSSHLYGDGTAGEKIAGLLSKIDIKVEKRFTP